MRYWWVNQNQTFRQEFRGNSMWSPKRNANGGRNQFCENMRQVGIGDKRSAGLAGQEPLTIRAHRVVVAGIEAVENGARV